MEMKRREVGDFGQCLEIQRLIEVLVDVLEDPVHSADVFGPALGSRHVA